MFWTGIGAAQGPFSISRTGGASCVCVGLCLRRNHAPGEVVSWTGSFSSRRKLLGLSLHWSYAPAEVKVLTSADGGNFEEAAGWRKISRSEPSFEESIMFAAPLSATTVKVLMRGVKPWGYFGLAKAAALAGPNAFMLVSGSPGQEEICVVSSPGSDVLLAKACLDAVVDGDGRDVFVFTENGRLQEAGGSCIGVAGSKLTLSDCSGGVGPWEMTADGQLKQGNMCLAVIGAQVAATDCDEASSLGGDKFFEVAVPANDPTAVAGVRSLGLLLQASVQRQRKLTAALQGLLPKLATCKAISLKRLASFWKGSALFTRGTSASGKEAAASLATKIGERFGLSGAEIKSVLVAAAQAMERL